MLRNSPFIPDPNTQTHGGRPAVDVGKQVLVTLWYLSNTCSIRMIADRFGVAESSVILIVRRVCKAISFQANNIIKWPTGDRLKVVVGEFNEMKGLPGIVGLLDGCHLPIPAPEDDPDSYINRKNFIPLSFREFVIINCYLQT